ncbi:hypothetical protein F5879DRAFT_995000, partial [Lentinula edodes]
MPPPPQISSSTQPSSVHPAPLFSLTTNRMFAEVFKGRISGGSESARSLTSGSEDRSERVTASSSSAAPSMGSTLALGVEDGGSHYDLSVMASAVLNTTDISGIRSAAEIDESDLDSLGSLIQDAVQSTTSAEYDLPRLFDSPAAQNCTIHQALRRIESHKLELQKHLVALHELSPGYNPALIEDTLFRAERTNAAIASELNKYRRREVKDEVNATKTVARNLE